MRKVHIEQRNLCRNRNVMPKSRFIYLEKLLLSYIWLQKIKSIEKYRENLIHIDFITSILSPELNCKITH